MSQRQYKPFDLGEGNKLGECLSWVQISELKKILAPVWVVKVSLTVFGFNRIGHDFGNLPASGPLFMG